MSTFMLHLNGTAVSRLTSLQSSYRWSECNQEKASGENVVFSGPPWLLVLLKLRSYKYTVRKPLMLKDFAQTSYSKSESMNVLNI